MADAIGDFVGKYKSWIIAGGSALVTILGINYGPKVLDAAAERIGGRIAKNISKYQTAQNGGMPEGSTVLYGKLDNLLGEVSKLNARIDGIAKKVGYLEQ